MLLLRSAGRRRLRATLVVMGLVGSSLSLSATTAGAHHDSSSDPCPTEEYHLPPTSTCPARKRLKVGLDAPERVPGRLSLTTGALLGAHSDSDDDWTKAEQGIDILEGKIGRTLDIDNHYVGDFDYFLASANPYRFRPMIQLMEWDRESNRIPLLGWGCGDSHNIVAGQYDAAIDAAADSMKAYDRDFFMRYCWEMDGSRQDQSKVGSPEEFIDAWRYIWNRFELKGVDNVIWNWSTNAAKYKDRNDSGHFAWDYYPGDTYVDWVSADGYNWHGAAGRNDRNRFFLEIFDEFMIWARSTGPLAPEIREKDPDDLPASFPNKSAVKPIMIAEYGTQEQSDGGADKGDWFRNAHETVMPRTASTPASCVHCGAYSDIAALVYFDVSGKSADEEGGWDIETTAPSLAGYMEYSDHPWFNQIATLTWGPYTGTPPVQQPPVQQPPVQQPPVQQPPVEPKPETPAPVRSGYWMLGTDGKIYPFGDAKAHGSAPTMAAVDVEPTPSGNGYWVVDDLGRVYAFGDARYLGNVDLARLAPGERVTSLSATPSGHGYWIFTTRGRALAFGDARHFGDMSAVQLNGPVLDSIPTPSGNGYYMVGSDGGVFAFGDARFHGSTGGKRLNAPVQSLVPDIDGVGYWLVASDGGVFSFEAPFRGSTGSLRLNKPMTGMVPFGNGYLMVAEDGGIFNFSNKPFFGSLGSNPPARPVVSVAALD